VAFAMMMGNSKLGISTTGNSADVISANTHAKGLFTHAWQCMAKFGTFIFLPNFYLGTDSLLLVM